MSEGQTLAPGADRIEAIARATIAKLPPAFARHLGDVVLKIEEFADDATLDEMGIENPFELTGLYTGLPIGAKSVDHSGTMPDMIDCSRKSSPEPANQREPIASWIRAPAESMSQIIGMRLV